MLARALVHLQTRTGTLAGARNLVTFHWRRAERYETPRTVPLYRDVLERSRPRQAWRRRRSRGPIDGDEWDSNMSEGTWPRTAKTCRRQNAFCRQLTTMKFPSSKARLHPGWTEGGCESRLSCQFASLSSGRSAIASGRWGSGRGPSSYRDCRVVAESPTRGRARVHRQVFVPNTATTLRGATCDADASAPHKPRANEVKKLDASMPVFGMRRTRRSDEKL